MNPPQEINPYFGFISFISPRDSKKTLDKEVVDRALGLSLSHTGLVYSSLHSQSSID